MSFDNLALDILEEFAAAGSSVSEYLDGDQFTIRDFAASLSHLEAWRKDNADLLRSPPYRARAVEVAREWRVRKMSTPEGAAEHREDRRRIAQNRRDRWTPEQRAIVNAKRAAGRRARVAR